MSSQGSEWVTEKCQELLLQLLRTLVQEYRPKVLHRHKAERELQALPLSLLLKGRLSDGKGCRWRTGGQAVPYLPRTKPWSKLRWFAELQAGHPA